MRSATLQNIVLAMVICGASVTSGETPQTRPSSAPATQPQPGSAAAILRHELPEVNVTAVPLSDVIDGLRDLSGGSITLNETALAAAGMKRGTPVTFQGQKLTLAAALDGVLGPLAAKGVTYRAEGDVIFVSTKADLDNLAGFRQRNAAVLARADPFDNRLAAAANPGRPNLAMPGAPFKAALAELSQRGDVQIVADMDAMAQVGVKAGQRVQSQLRNPTLRDALLDVLWKTGRIDDLQIELKGKTITIAPRVREQAI